MKDLLAELEEDSSDWITSQTYLWGLDLTQSFQGAGGVGGLLSITRNDAPGTTNYYPTYDANGNVMELWDELGNNVAIYRYGSFGELVSIMIIGQNVRLVKILIFGLEIAIMIMLVRILRGRVILYVEQK